MDKQTHRLRMFAGPNGSGKSTIKQKITEKLGADQMGVIVDPDEIEAIIHQNHLIDFRNYNINISKEEIINGLNNSSVLEKQDLRAEIPQLEVIDNLIRFSKVRINSYFASAISEMIRSNLIQSKQSFSFETVMSHHSKIELLKFAQEQSYRTYLYYVATDDADINVERVKNRVFKGGHDVSADKIKERYTRSIDLLKTALLFTNRAYVFDNSGDESILMIEITDGKNWEVKSNTVHPWFDSTYEYLKEHSERTIHS